MKAAFRFLASMKLAIYLLAAMAGMYVVAALYGNTAVYQSWLFQAVAMMFWLNLFLCTVEHIPPIIKSIRRKGEDISYDGAGYETLGNISKERLLAYLKEKRYKFDLAEDGERILAKKALPALIAPQLLHVGILVILIGVLITSQGVSGAVICADGQSVQLPKVVREAMGEKAKGYMLTVDRFSTIYDENGAVDNWVSEITFTTPQGEQVKGETKVNAPFKHDGITIYQNSYKYQYLVEILGSNDAGTYALPDDQTFYLENDVKIRFNEMDTEHVVLSIQVGEASPTHALMSAGKIVEIYPGVTIEYGGKTEYTILEVKYEPGIGIVFAGFILVTLASFLFLFGRYKEIRLRRINGMWQVMAICRSKELLREDVDGLRRLREE